MRQTPQQEKGGWGRPRPRVPRDVDTTAALHNSGFNGPANECIIVCLLCQASIVSKGNPDNFGNARHAAGGVEALFEIRTIQGSLSTGGGAEQRATIVWQPFSKRIALISNKGALQSVREQNKSSQSDFSSS